MNTIDVDQRYAFVVESNRIEGIHRSPTEAELDEFDRFMALSAVTIADLERFVAVYQPDARLRDKPGLNVRVGVHRPPSGGPHIRKSLQVLLDDLSTHSAFQAHVRFESLHPFTDGNGRSGRALWAWQHRDLSLGFLHRFYYQALAEQSGDVVPVVTEIVTVPLSF